MFLIRVSKRHIHSSNIFGEYNSVHVHVDWNKNSQNTTRFSGHFESSRSTAKSVGQLARFPRQRHLACTARRNQNIATSNRKSANEPGARSEKEEDPSNFFFIRRGRPSEACTKVPFTIKSETESVAGLAKEDFENLLNPHWSRRQNCPRLSQGF